jgi:hypothetical protein
MAASGTIVVNWALPENQVGKLVFGFVTSYPPKCIERLEDILYAFVRPPAQEAWLHDIRDTVAYQEAREKLISQLRVKLPVAVVQALDERVASYDKAASHALREHVATLSANTQADFAALTALLWATHPTQPSSHRRTLSRTAWDSSGLERNLLQLNIRCPNCQEEGANLEVADGLYVWELTCPSCGYGDRAAADMPHASGAHSPQLADQVWSSWAGSTSAAFADWDLSIRRRTSFMEKLGAFRETIEENLAAELATLANTVKEAPADYRAYSFSSGVCAVLYAQVQGSRGAHESVHLHDSDADRLAIAQRHRGHLSLVEEHSPYPHWEAQFKSRLDMLRAALESADPLQACVAAGQLLLEARWYGFLLPLRLTVKLGYSEGIEFSELVTHPQHLAAYLEEKLATGLKGRPTRAQLEEFIRNYVRRQADQKESQHEAP